MRVPLIFHLHLNPPPSMGRKPLNNFLKFSFSSLPLRERIKVKDAVESFLFVSLIISLILEKIKNPPHKGEDLNKTEKPHSSLHYHH
ncbi:hypothetical protein, partial [Candidatus Thermokryptus mobilis]|uniref:hypothetical protein n=1 Tax=Candidatus Thermokryptus mobilis TaxID=1643428 RepID=UPI00112C6E5C